MQPRVVIHYPRDGVTYMIGHCGANSISSTTDLSIVTCDKCKESLRGQEGMIEQKVSFELWMKRNGVKWSHLREKEKRQAVLKWKS